MEFPPVGELVLTVISGVCWMIVYEECIRIGLTQKTCCMPLFALTLNLAWESLYSALGFIGGRLDAQTIVNALWFGMDAVILYTYLKNGRNEPGARTGRDFYIWAAAAVAVSYAVQIAFVLEYGQLMAMRYSAYLQNAVMSVLFVEMLRRRGSSRGQSMLLAVAKWLGTLAPLGNQLWDFQPLILVCGIVCSVYDLWYIALLDRRLRAERAGGNAAARRP